MEAVRESWTDERLDEFGRRIDERFDRIETRIGTDYGRIDARLDAEFGRIDARLDSIGRAIAFGAIAFSSSVIAGFVAIATQI